MSRQPVWEFLANLGDANPLEYGGFFVYADATGVYPPEAELLEVLDGSDDPAYAAFRFVLEPHTFVGGVLSDNPFHPECPPWYAETLADVAAHAGTAEAALRADFLSGDPLARASAHRAVGEYHGFDNLDSYHMTLTRAEARARYLANNGTSY